MKRESSKEVHFLLVNQKILSLKISGKHLAVMQEISSQKYKIIVYNLDKENKIVYSAVDINYQSTNENYKNCFDLT